MSYGLSGPGFGHRDSVFLRRDRGGDLDTVDDRGGEGLENLGLGLYVDDERYVLDGVLDI